jgi:hypothetical protein
MRGELVTKAELKSRDGKHRLRLLYVDVGGNGWDFHSLSLEAFQDDVWLPMVLIDQDGFQGSSPFRRWVSDLHSFSPTSKQAIMQVAEGNRPIGLFSVSYVYSWRRWDLSANCELAVLKVCQSPHEPL